MNGNIFNKEVKDLSIKDKIIFGFIIVIFILIIILGIIIINNKNDSNKNTPNKDKVTKNWKTSTVVEFNKDQDAEFYEYCISIEKDNKNCLWSRTQETSVTINDNGHKYVYFKLIDASEKVIKEEMEEVFIDNTPPIINNIELLDEEQTTVRVIATDNISSIDKYYYSLDGKEYFEGTMTYTFKDVSKDSNQIIYVKVIDEAGNSEISEIKLGTNK